MPVHRLSSLSPTLSVVHVWLSLTVLSATCCSTHLAIGSTRCHVSVRPFVLASSLIRPSIVQPPPSHGPVFSHPFAFPALLVGPSVASNHLRRCLSLHLPLSNGLFPLFELRFGRRFPASPAFFVYVLAAVRPPLSRCRPLSSQLPPVFGRCSATTRPLSGQSPPLGCYSANHCSSVTTWPLFVRCLVAVRPIAVVQPPLGHCLAVVRPLSGHHSANVGYSPANHRRHSAAVRSIAAVRPLAAAIRAPPGCCSPVPIQPSLGCRSVNRRRHLAAQLVFRFAEKKMTMINKNVG